MNQEILFDNLEYGMYRIERAVGSFNENYRYDKADINTLYTRRVRLPDGKGNTIYLLSDTFENSVRMLMNDNFIIPSTYTKIFYPLVCSGKFLGKQFRFNNSKERADRVNYIRNNTRFHEYPSRSLSSSTENVLFSAADIYSAIKPLLEKSSVVKCYEKFYPEFIQLLLHRTPEPKKENKDKSWNNKIIIIDCDAFRFKMGAPLSDNRSNPLYLLYLAYMRIKDLSTINVDMDMLVCSKNLFMKFNPSKLNTSTWNNFKKGLFKIMDADMDNYTDQLSDYDKSQIENSGKMKLLSNIIKDQLEPYTKMVSTSTASKLTDAIEDKLKKKAQEISNFDKAIKQTKEEIGKNIGSKPDIFVQSLPDNQQSILHTNPAINPLSKKQETLFSSISGYEPLGTLNGLTVDDEDGYDEYPEDEDTVEEFEDEIRDDVTELLTDDEEIMSEVLDDIQDKAAPINNQNLSPINSARDKKLREEQKKIVVKNSTIEEILEMDADNVPIQVEDKSAVMHTSNKNMYNIRFANFNKTYLENLYAKDIISCFDVLKDKSSPFYITGVDIKDTSTNLDYKETWTVHLTDENKKHHTIKVDIPKFKDDRFMFFRGTKWIILNQNFYNPLVKDTPDTVIITTNYNKVTVTRKATKSLGTVERIFSLMKKTGDQKMFVTGNSSRGNMKYISTLEYDEISKSLFKFTSEKCELYFSRDYIKENFLEQISDTMNGNEFFIGYDGNRPVFINEDTGLDRLGRTIADIIEMNLPDDYRAIYNSVKAPAASMYAEAKMAGESVPVLVILLQWIGITNILNTMKIFWKFHQDAKRMTQTSSTRRYIRFADGILEYEAKTFAELIMNGISKLHPEKLKFSDFDTETCYDEFIYTKWGSYNGIWELRNFYEFLVDPITKKGCKIIGLPDDAPGLLIHAVKLLSDNAYVSKASDKSYRVRTIEMISGILYECIAKQYKAYVKSGHRMPMTLNQRCVINHLIAEKTVEAYSTLNPVVEVSKTHTISTKGFKGSNSEHAYKDEEKRSYDPSALGKLAMSTSPDANVGINKSLVVEPTILNARGYRDNVDESEFKDVNIFSPTEMLTPGTAIGDDPIRTAIAGKQSQHIVPTKDASPALISNGFDEAVQFHLSDDFVINAEEDGQVVDVNEETGFIMVKYKSGKTKAIYTKPEMVKNSGGGFYMSNTLTPTCTKVGEKFKKDEPLAYHPKYFRYSKLNGLRFSIGPLAKMAIMSSYNTYEDAGICTETLAGRMQTSIVYDEVGRFKRNNNILYMVNIGDTVNIGDPLIRFNTSTEDNELSKYLTKLSQDSATILEEETRDEIKSNHAGRVVDIKVYTLLEPSNLSPSLGKIVQDYFDRGIKKKEYLEQFDHTESTMKAGYLLTDSTEPVVDRYNTIKGDKGVDVRIEIYIEHEDVMGVGDKIALYGPNKQIVSEVIPKGWEPYSELRPDEEISLLTSPGTISRRMTISIAPITAAMKIMVELKRKIKDEVKYR